MKKCLGIDLGSGFSCMSILEGGEPKVIPNAEGQRTTPSIVAWTKDGELLVGQSAKRQAITNPKRTVYEAKRIIGRKYSECTDAVKLMSYDVCAADNGDCRIKIDDKLYSPEEIGAFILKKLKKDAEAYLGEKIDDCVITCPAYFTEPQKTATKNAGIIAGFNVLRVIAEPTSAALSYGKDRDKGEKIIAVFDDGSCTTDFSILSISDGVIETLAVNGINTLGGRNYDEKIMEWLISEFKTETGVDLSQDSMAVQRIKDESEKAKIALSTAQTYDINIPFITSINNTPQHLNKTLTRSQFERLIAPLNAMYESPMKECINDAKAKIDEVILVGGSCRIPSIQAEVKRITGIEPSMTVNLDEVVSCGAAIQGGIITGDVTDVLLLDVTPLDIGIETMGEIFTPIIEKNTTIPTKKSQVFSTAVDNQPAVTIRIATGNRKMFADNKLIGNFNLDGIPPAPRGVPQIEVTIDVDASNIISVSAKDLGTQKEQKITITSGSGLSKDDIERMKADAEKYAADDEKRVKLATGKNMADSLCNQIEKTMKDHTDKITEDDKKSIDAEIVKVRESIKSDKIEDIDKAVDGLNKVWSPVIQKLYPQQSSSNGQTGGFNPGDMFNGANGGFSGATPPNSKSDDNGPVDAEVI